MRSGMPRGLFLLALTSIIAPLALGGCMSKAKKHLYAAEDLFEKRDLKGAQAELQEAIKDDPDLLDAHKSLAHIDEALGDEDGAGQEYDTVSRLDPTDTRALGKARYYRQLKQTESLDRRCDRRDQGRQVRGGAGRAQGRDQGDRDQKRSARRRWRDWAGLRR